MFEKLFYELVEFIQNQDADIYFDTNYIRLDEWGEVFLVFEKHGLSPIIQMFNIHNTGVQKEHLFTLMHEYGHILAYREIGLDHTEQDAWDCAILGLPGKFYKPFLKEYNDFKKYCLSTYDLEE